MTRAKTVRRKPQAKAAAWKAKFIAALREYAVVRYACEQAGVERSTAYKAREQDDAFAAAWHDAQEDGCDLLELEARRRAVEGVEHPIIHKGEVVGTTVYYSDGLLLAMLKAHRAEYREQTTVEAGGELLKYLKALHAARDAGPDSRDVSTDWLSS